MNKALSIFNQLRPLSVGYDDVFDTFESFLDVSVEDGVLTIESKTSDKDESKDEDGNTIYKGISKRYFKRQFTIANDVEVKGAELKDGLLKVSMEKIVPESKKLRTIDIK
jgi:molecular chaperone IbpA